MGFFYSRESIVLSTPEYNLQYLYWRTVLLLDTVVQKYNRARQAGAVVPLYSIRVQAYMFI